MLKYSNDDLALMFLSQFDFTYKKCTDILDNFNSAGDIFKASESELLELKDIIGDKYYDFVDALINFNSQMFLNKLENKGIKCITIYSENYPDRLNLLSNPPLLLYYVGNIKLLKLKALAVVGSRTASGYGKMVTEKFVKDLAQKNIAIVSGLATGIDKVAHEATLEVGGSTIAVLGGGFDHMFPAMNINLAREIAKKGLILTEYYSSVRPTKYTFPNRNRIIAGLSSAVLIPEAKKGSGSLYTKEYADTLGIDTYCVPGNINNELSYATNDLIKKGTAFIATCPEDLYNTFGLSIKSVKEEKVQKLNIEETMICDLLKHGEQSFDFLQEKTQFSTSVLNINLTSLEIRGIIKKLAGNMFMLCS